MSLGVARLTGSLGAEVRGIDLAHPTDADISTVEELITEHLVLFFPDQNLSTEEHLAFGRRLGPLEAHPNAVGVSDTPEIFELRASAGGIADEWHSDLTFQAEPALYSILSMQTCPPVGGDTMFANMYRAYEELSPPLRGMCDGLTALHDADPHGRSDRTTIHPVVRVHPVTGRRSLFVNEHFTRRIVEMSHEESELLLGHLTRWASNPRFAMRYRWAEGTVAMWDNRCTQHYVIDDFDQERVIRRVTVMGDSPEGVAGPRWEPWARVGGAPASSRLDRQHRRHLAESAD